MSENIPESIPTSQDPRSRRPIKRRALSPTSKQAAHLDALFANPNKPIQLPPSSDALAKPSSLAPPEIVSNVQGSSAGAGSGEFHVYKASRRREYERLRAMDEEKEKEEQDAEFKAKQEDMRSKDDEKTARNRAKREKARLRQMKKKGNLPHEENDKKEGAEKARFKPNITMGGITEGGNVEIEESKEVENPEEIGIIIHDED